MGAVCFGRVDDDPAIAASQVVHDVGRFDLGVFQHLFDDPHGGRDIDRTQRRRARFGIRGCALRRLQDNVLRYGRGPPNGRRDIEAEELVVFADIHPLPDDDGPGRS